MNTNTIVNETDKCEIAFEDCLVLWDWDWDIRSISDNDVSEAVSAEALHMYLGMSQPFTTWLESTLKALGYEAESEDNCAIDYEEGTDRVMGHVLSLQVAREIALLCATEKSSSVLEQLKLPIWNERCRVENNQLYAKGRLLVNPEYRGKFIQSYSWMFQNAKCIDATRFTTEEAKEQRIINEIIFPSQPLKAVGFMDDLDLNSPYQIPGTKLKLMCVL